MLRAYQQGDHICSLYVVRTEQLKVAAQFLAEGLRRGEQCLYSDASEAALEEFREALSAEGVSVAPAEASGSLLLRTKQQTHLRSGVFNCEEMLDMLNGAVESALNAGFTGLRTCGDMSWLLDEGAGAERVFEYEALLNQFFKNVRGLGMCQYDRHRLPPPAIDAALSTHASVHVAGILKANPHYRRGATAPSRARAGDVARKLQAILE